MPEAHMPAKKNGSVQESTHAEQHEVEQTAKKKGSERSRKQPANEVTRKKKAEDKPQANVLRPSQRGFKWPAP
jgi:transglutaminase/protease-like cytokinesis protein 3